MLSKLLAENDPRYLRRLRRAINESAPKHGVYCEGRKLCGVRYSADTLFLIPLQGAPIPYNGQPVFDGYGRPVSASRVV